jgi:hypothetical protein
LRDLSAKQGVIFLLRIGCKEATGEGSAAALVAMGAGAPGIDGQSSGTKSKE